MDREKPFKEILWAKYREFIGLDATIGRRAIKIIFVTLRVL